MNETLNAIITEALRQDAAHAAVTAALHRENVAAAVLVVFVVAVTVVVVRGIIALRRHLRG